MTSVPAASRRQPVNDMTDNSQPAQQPDEIDKHEQALLAAAARVQQTSQDAFSLDSDAPLTGGACNLDGTCEACQ